MEPAAGSERRNPPGPAVPPPPRGHAPLAAAPSPPGLSSLAREPPQPEEERQPRISESGQFSDGLEDRGERAPPRPLPHAGSAARGAAALGPPLLIRGLHPRLRGSAPPSVWGAEPGHPREGAGNRGRQPHLLRSAGPRQRLFLRPPLGRPSLVRNLLLVSPSPSSAHRKSLGKPGFCFWSRALSGDRLRALPSAERPSSTRLPSRAPFLSLSATQENFSGGLAFRCFSVATGLPASEKGATWGASPSPELPQDSSGPDPDPDPHPEPGSQWALPRCVMVGQRAGTVGFGSLTSSRWMPLNLVLP